ncbi:MAG: G5 domain-containing protein, partial [Oscillospiraceae bacterium]|nr:G5 domain-containing protein [Oscillospiraceae bacterium]
MPNNQQHTARAFRFHRLMLLSLLAVAAVLTLLLSIRADAVYLVKDGGDIVALDGAQPAISDERIIVSGAANKDPNVRLAANQSIVVIHDGERQTLTTRTSETVSSLINRLGIAVGPLDLVLIDISDSHTLTVEVGESFVFYEKEAVSASYETQYVANYKLPKGTTVVAQEGSNGYSTATYEVVYADGELVSRQLVEQSGNTSIPCIVEYGTLVSEAGRDDTIAEVITEEDGSGYLILNSGDSLRFSAVKEVTATAYTAGTPGVGTRTATGTTVHVGVVAVDKRVFPLGTSMFITSPYDGGFNYGYGHAEDTGVRGN